MDNLLKMSRPTKLDRPFLSFPGDDEVSPADGMSETIESAIARVELHRYLDCRVYSACLSDVVKQGWLGFSCQACPMAEGHL